MRAACALHRGGAQPPPSSRIHFHMEDMGRRDDMSERHALSTAVIRQSTDGSRRIATLLLLEISLTCAHVRARTAAVGDSRVCIMQGEIKCPLPRTCTADVYFYLHKRPDAVQQSVDLVTLIFVYLGEGVGLIPDHASLSANDVG